VIIGLILLLVILEFIIPIVRGQKGKPEETNNNNTEAEIFP
jgi:hypothetical protein